MFRRTRKTQIYILLGFCIIILTCLLWKCKEGTICKNRPTFYDTADEQLVRYKIKTSNLPIYERFLERRRFLRSRCSKISNGFSYPVCNEIETKSYVKYVKSGNIAYCAVEKTGSTFWKRILHIAGGWGNVSNPTYIELKDAYNETGGYMSMKSKTWTEIENIVKVAESLMFVRDPFTRLFSGWLDKFYSPNWFYWNSTGRYILETQRNNFDFDRLECASDVSFVEFVNHTVNEILSNRCVDGHFSTMYSHCLPCSFDYRYIGKYETIKEDTETLLDVLGLSNQVTFGDFDNDAVFDAIKDAADWVFSKKKKVISCGVSFSCALFRVWGRLQSRGIISKEIRFPYATKDETRNLSQELFEKDIIKAHEGSPFRDLKHNRNEALFQALKTLPLEVLNKLLSAFEMDFDLFGYDRIPFTFGETEHSSEFEYCSTCPKELR